PPHPPRLPYTTLFRSVLLRTAAAARLDYAEDHAVHQALGGAKGAMTARGHPQRCRQRVVHLGRRDCWPYRGRGMIPVRKQTARLDRKSTRLNSSHLVI